MAASTRVGNLLGLQSAAGAKRASHASALLSVVIGAIVMFILMATKDVRSGYCGCLVKKLFTLRL